MSQRQDQQRDGVVTSARLGDRRRLVCCLAGLLTVWLNLVLAVVLPLAQAMPSGQVVASAGWSGAVTRADGPAPVCTRNGIKWIGSDGQPVDPPSHPGHSLCPFCLPLAGGVLTPPPIVVAAIVSGTEPIRFAADHASATAAPIINPAARPRAPPLSIIL